MKIELEINGDLLHFILKIKDQTFVSDGTSKDDLDKLWHEILDEKLWNREEVVSTCLEEFPCSMREAVEEEHKVHQDGYYYALEH